MLHMHTDLVITISVPFTQPAWVRAEGSLSAPGWQGHLSGARGEMLDVGIRVRDKVLETIRIVNWGRFSEAKIIPPFIGPLLPA